MSVNLEEHTAVLWQTYRGNPHLGSLAMMQLWLPLVGDVSEDAVGGWLEKARTCSLGLSILRGYRSCAEGYLDLHPDATVPQLCTFL